MSQFVRGLTEQIVLEFLEDYEQPASLDEINKASIPPKDQIETICAGLADEGYIEQISGGQFRITSQGQERLEEWDGSEQPVSDKVSALLDTHGQIEPQYTLVPINRTPSVDPGDSIVIDLYLSGVGMIQNHKLHLTNSHIKLQEDRPGSVTTPFVETDSGDLLVGQTAMEHEKPTQFPLNRTGHTMGLPVTFFFETPDYNSTYPRIFSEVDVDSYPPIRIEMNTSAEIAPGDYNLTFVYTYGTEVFSKQDRRSVSIHVNNHREQLEPWPTRLAIAGAVAAVLSLILQGIISSFQRVVLSPVSSLILGLVLGSALLIVANMYIEPEDYWTTRD